MINEITCSDCLEAMRLIPDKAIDMILCDLPYGTTACKWDTIIPFEPLWEQYKRIVKDNSAIVLTASQPFTSALTMSNPKWYRYEWIWEKSRPTGFLDSNRKPLKSHENICIFYGSQTKYFPQGVIYKTSTTTRVGLGRSPDTNGKTKQVFETKGMNYPRSIISIPSESGTSHPTQKPVALMEYLIKTYTNEGDTVLDNCMGSGTTGVACKNLNRNFIGIEKDPAYFEIAKKRIEEA
jgi:site-specific DNA-methyltransferase (adenine-specific)